MEQAIITHLLKQMKNTAISRLDPCESGNYGMGELVILLAIRLNFCPSSGTKLSNEGGSSDTGKEKPLSISLYHPIFLSFCFSL